MFLISLESILSIIVLGLLVLVIAFLIVITILLKVSGKVLSKNGSSKKEHYDELNLNASKNEVVFLGDSLTDFYDTDEFFHNVSSYNRGIAGDTTDGVLARLQSNVICLNPSKVFLQIGTNDLGLKKSVDYVYNNILKIISTLKEYCPETKLYIISLYPVNESAHPYSKVMVKPRKNKDIVTLNNMLMKYCNENKITYIDVHSFLIDDEGRLKKEYTVEGLHISFDGYLVVTKVLSEYINE